MADIFMSQQELLEQLSQLKSENAMLRSQNEGYKIMAEARESEWRRMSLKTMNNTDLESNMQHQQDEIKIMQEQMRLLNQRIEGGLLRENELTRKFETTDSYAYKNEDLKSQLHQLQSELEDMKEALKRLAGQNSFLQSYVTRNAELESLLANAEEEIERLKEDK